MTRAIKQVDVFTNTLGMGNPVAVVLGADGLSDREMAEFARWTNLSETTFILEPTAPGADYLVRIFTPTVELPFAGHPTIGTCHAWLEAGGTPQSADQIVQECDAGLVALRRVDGRLSFQTPPRMQSGPVQHEVIERTLSSLGLDPAHVVDTEWCHNGPPWVGVLVESPEVLRALEPTWDHDDIYAGVAALLDDGTGEPALEVRAFFNAGGTREDPVTGSLNGALAQWLIGIGTLTAPYVSSQGTSMGRDGRVFISTTGPDEIWVGGDAITGIDGRVAL